MADDGYGKRPMWQWMLIYIVVGGLIYFAVYQFFLKGNTSYSLPGSGSSGTTQTNPGTGY